jgi:4-hydroxybenzoate polyprenyltransferase
MHRPGTLPDVADLQRRGSYTPRRIREQRAYRLAVGGSVAGVVGVVTLILAIAGVIGGGVPLIAFIVAALCAVGFVRTVNAR